MPELPEVETSRRGIAPHVLNNTIKAIILRREDLRWPIPQEIKPTFTAQCITQLERRGKYLLFHAEPGTLILHLGMSGSLRIVKADTPAHKHDHVDIVFTDGICLRFTDPRRFGCLLWTATDPLQHRLLKSLGIEPLSQNFNADYLWTTSRHRHITTKQLIMHNAIVVGVGNIYANEALFDAGIRPTKVASRLSKTQCQRLVKAIKFILRRAIKAGGTTLQDFTQSDGKPGYFKQSLNVYSRDTKPCLLCKTPIKTIIISGRSSFYCPHCQR